MELSKFATIHPRQTGLVMDFIYKAMEPLSMTLHMCQLIGRTTSRRRQEVWAWTLLVLETG